MAEIESENLIKFKANSNIIVTGQSHAGKSTFVFSLLKQLKLFESNIQHILYVYGIWQPLFDRMEREISSKSFTKEFRIKKFWKDILANMVTSYWYWRKLWE